MRIGLLGLVALSLGLLFPPPAHGQEAGTLVSAEPVVDTPPGSQAWRIAYWTRSEDDRPLRVTGMVVAPREAAPRAPRNIVAWAHGTSGVVERCAISTNPAFFEVTPGLSEMIAAGYVVAAPDYPGLGSPMPHGYLAGRETARSVLDAARAARQIPGAHAGSDLVVWGESQGGHAALWTAAEAPRYARELNLLGVAAAAPPTDLLRTMERAQDLNVRAMLTAFMAYSWSERFGTPIGSLFGPVNRGVARRLAQNNCIELGARPRLGTILGIVSIRNALRNIDLARAPGGWARLARNNSVRARDIRVPVHIAQSEEDTIVTASLTRDFANRLCRRGQRVHYESLAGVDHAHTARDSRGSALAWIADRFAGRPAASNCRRS